MNEKVFVLAGPWASKMNSVFVQLTSQINAGNIKLPLDVTAQQNGVTVLFIALDVNAEIAAMTLGNFPSVTFPLAATVKAANRSFQINIS